jgi:Dockerin type I domain/Bacterial Ig domain
MASFNKNKSNGEINRLVLRKLRFDSLEDRRLLAGLNVFVYDDANASQVWETSAEQGTANRVVFLDNNLNGQIDIGERWVKTNDQGAAIFNNLAIGTYYPTLVDGNHSVLQTTQTTSAEFGKSLNVGVPTKLVEWASDSQAWVVSNNQLALMDFQLEAFTNQVSVTGNILGAAVNVAEDRALILSDLGLAGRQLTLVNLTNGSSQVVAGVTGLPKQVLRMNETFLVITQDALTTSLYRVDTGVGTPLLRPLPTAMNLNNSTFQAAAGADLLFVEQARGTGSIVAALTVSRTDATVSQQLISGTFSSWTVNRLGTLMAVESTTTGVRVFNVPGRFRQVATLGDSVGPIAFDSTRNQLLTGSKTSASLIDAWSAKNWAKVYSINTGVNASTPISMTGSQISTSGLSTRFAAFSNSGMYVHDVAVIRQTPVQLLSTSERKRLDIGQRLIGANQTPSMQTTEITSPEDMSIPIGVNLLRQLTSEADSDFVHYFLANPPQNGTIDWSPSTGGVYLPNANFFGSDSVVVQAFDGRDWANPQTISLDITPVNDAPISIDVPPIEIGERIVGGQEIGVITVVDPDPGAIYEITVDDPRIFVVGGILKIAQDAQFDFESESSVVLEIVANDTKEPSDTISRTITINVSDENDAPTDFTIDSTSVAENDGGGLVGVLTVADPDSADQYTWEISDNRFVVVNDELRLAAGQSLDFESQSTIDILMTAVDKGSERFSKSVSVQVEDRNDPAVAIHLEKTDVVERVRGFRVGSLTVQDQDVDEKYEFSFNDPRFEVADGTLRLKRGKFISFETESQIPLEITATSMANGTQIKRSVQLSVTPNSAPWRNKNLPVDVDGDGVATPRDALRIINDLNKNGIRPLNDAPENSEGPGGDEWTDVNGDGRISPIDAIIVINHLNRFGNGSGGGTGGGTGEGGGGGEGEGPSSATTPPQSSIAGDRVYDMSLEAYLVDLAREQNSNKRRAR